MRKKKPTVSIRNIARRAPMPKGTRNRLHAIAYAVDKKEDQLRSTLATAVQHLKTDWQYFAFDMGPGCEDAVRLEEFLTRIGHPRPADGQYTAVSASAVQPERCCLDYPRCDCNSPPEPEDAPTLQPCGHPWKAQHDFKCILCSSPGPAHEECLGCSSPTTCEKYGCSVKRQRAIDSASGDRDATSAQSAEEQRFLHGAANGIGPDPLLQEIALRALASGPTITLTLDEVRALYKFLPGAPGCIAQEAAI